MTFRSAKYYCVFLLLLFIVQNIPAQRSKSIASTDQVKTYVTDRTGTLTSAQLKSLETKLAAFEKETSNQLVVWMEPSLDGGSVEDRSYELAEQNGIGQKSKNNGVLLYIAKNDRKLRIEVGYGLEGALTDALSSQIIRKEITPQFKKADFYGGINAGVDAIIKATKGEYQADKESKDDDDDGAGICCVPFPFLMIFFIFFFIIGMNILSRIFGWNKGKSGSNWWGTGGGWSSGSGSSSGWSGGGFSGGGGSFGGGGSSGSW